MATATLAAQLVEEGALRLDAPVAAVLPASAPRGKERVTVRHLLAHSAGSRAGARGSSARPRIRSPARPSCRPPARPPPAALAAAFARGQALVREAVLAEPLEAPPGTRALYCDPGFLALGLPPRGARSASRSRALAGRRVFGPLGLADTFFLDGLEPERALARAAGRAFAPTEPCEHRHEVNQGTVNDDNAWAMGGVAGHAGLFSTALDVAALGQAWLDALRGRRSVVPAGAAREFARRDATPGTTRALGWDTPLRRGLVARDAARARAGGAIGHLGFTGTSLWIDLDARGGRGAPHEPRPPRPRQRADPGVPAPLPRRGGGGARHPVDPVHREVSH